ncbi:hypothetical protein B0J13DRAFT_543481 [Dactylonectria estremocensis]|uniref:Uncharacterized protein n=1 Tax=Dactylonectria estremocensis TaxID=1079267 RepID=A0A9P9JF09_9HYPO|nr:hypothetical protein B0J13DRAFT_543481 [Dactylonectria estremocensis]
MAFCRTAVWFCFVHPNGINAHAHAQALRWGHIEAGCARQSIAVYHNRPLLRLVGLIGHRPRCRLIFSCRRCSGMKMRNMELSKSRPLLKGFIKGGRRSLSKRNSGWPNIQSCRSYCARYGMCSPFLHQSLNKGLASLASWHNITSGYGQEPEGQG